MVKIAKVKPEITPIKAPKKYSIVILESLTIAKIPQKAIRAVIILFLLKTTFNIKGSNKEVNIGKVEKVNKPMPTELNLIDSKKVTQ